MVRVALSPSKHAQPTHHAPASLLVYLFGLIFTANFILIFILSIILLSIDFYNIKNIAGRRLVGLRWWNEVNPASGDTTMVFESLPAEEAEARVNATDKRFFWLALYLQPLLWFALGLVAIVKLELIWLTLVSTYTSAPDECSVLSASRQLLTAPVIALILTVTNTVAFSRCDKFSQANNIASSALNTGGIAGSLASGMVSRFFAR